jgi:GT2 family glycosyltransferase
MKEKTAIIISTYSQDKLLEENIKSIKKNNPNSNYKVYLIDDASEKNIGAKIKKKFSFVNLITNKKNLGFSKSNNLGIQKAKKEYDPDWFLIYNDDCEIIENNWLNKFIKKTKNFPRAGIFGCQLIYPNGSIQWGTKNNKNYFFKEKGTKERNQEFSKTQETTEIIGACMLIKKEGMDKIKGFDEKFSPFYGEESDLCFRAKKEGFKIIYVGDLKLIHHRNKSINKLSKEKIWFIRKRNSIRLEFKHYSFWKIFYYGIFHFGAIFKKEGPRLIKKFNLLMDAYFYNVRNIVETREFRRS